jgi:hypothetical protein
MCANARAHHAIISDKKTGIAFNYMLEYCRTARASSCFMKQVIILPLLIGGCLELQSRGVALQDMRALPFALVADKYNLLIFLNENGGQRG